MDTLENNSMNTGSIYERLRSSSQRFNETGLDAVYFPVQELVHRQNKISKISLNHFKGSALVRLLKIFGEVAMKEISFKKWLQKDLSDFVSELSRQVDRICPIPLMLKHAAFHFSDKFPIADILTSDMSSNFTHDLRSGEFPTCIVTKPFRNLKSAKAEDCAQLKAIESIFQSASLDTINLEKLTTPVDAVFRFIRAYCVLVLEQQKVFGNNHNRVVFERYLNRYLRLGVRDQLPIAFMIAEMHLDKLPWLKRAFPENHCIFALDFFNWIFRNLINIALNRLFYATDTLFLKSQILFFRREVWDLLTAAATRQQVSAGLWESVPDATMNFVKESRMDRVTIYKARFMPRKNGVRPIMVRQPADPHHVKQWDMKARLRNSRRVLHYLMDLYQIRGIGKASLDDIQKSWISFRRQRTSLPNNQLFFVTCDVKQAYDKVNCEKLCVILERLRLRAIKNGLQYLFIFDKKKAQPDKQKKGGPRFQVVSKADFLADFDAEGLGDPECLNIDLVFQELLKMARPAFFKTDDTKWYRFVQGIPQGSPLSGVLLNLYFGQLEVELQCHTLPGEFLCRWMDDIIFITENIHRAEHFLRGVREGFPGLSLSAGQAKTHTNCPQITPSLPYCSHENARVLRWYGWYIHLDDLSLTADLSRFTDFNMRYGANVNFRDGQVYARSLVATLTGKYSSPLFDIECLSLDAVIQNICELFLLSGIYLHHLWKKSMRNQRSHDLVLGLLYRIKDSLVFEVMRMLRIGGIQSLSKEVVNFLAWDAWAFVLAGRGGSRMFENSLNKDTKGVIRNIRRNAMMSAVEAERNVEMKTDLENISEKFIRDVPQEFRLCA